MASFAGSVASAADVLRIAPVVDNVVNVPPAPDTNKLMRRLKLTFLGTRGGIIIRSPQHYRHSSLLVRHGSSRVMVDCGLDWLDQVSSISPTAIVLTHAHPDHAAGLAWGASCPVYATRETWALLGKLRIRHRCALVAGRFNIIDNLRFKAFPVEHSHHAPAVGLRICTDRTCLVYVPDVAEIPDRPRSLQGIELYIGDGSTVRRSMVRRKHGTLVGHAPITAQLDWCKEAGVRRAIFTHLGSPIVRGSIAEIDAIVRRLGIERGIDAQTAVDGLRLSLGRPHQRTRLRAPSKSASGSPKGLRTTMVAENVEVPDIRAVAGKISCLSRRHRPRKAEASPLRKRVRTRRPRWCRARLRCAYHVPSA